MTPDFAQPESAVVRLHLTNVVGLGAVQLLQSLLPSLQRQHGVHISDIYLPGTGQLAATVPLDQRTRCHIVRRHLPNALSRVLECTLLGGRFSGESPLLVLGDLPIRCRAPQTVFVQSSLLTNADPALASGGQLKYQIARTIFERNIPYASGFIVQTPSMKRSLEETYPAIAHKIHIVPQPPPAWLLAARLHRSGPAGDVGQGLNLFYPAASYPHKNHALLAQIAAGDPAWQGMVRRLALTLPVGENPNPGLPWIDCVDRLAPDGVIAEYRQADALLFMSLAESLGFPLIEAMSSGLPIVCPDLPYARSLCGDQAIYFNAHDARSLANALAQLKARLAQGWWPHWRAALAGIPADWDAVARQMLHIASLTD